jgi:hypothetical protein
VCLQIVHYVLKLEERARNMYVWVVKCLASDNITDPFADGIVDHLPLIGGDVNSGHVLKTTAAFESNCEGLSRLGSANPAGQPMTS